MTLAALSQHMTGRRGQKPAARKASLRGSIGALLLTSCGTTPIEAVAADGNAAGQTPETTTKCDEPSAGRYLVTTNDACLGRGAPVTNLNEPAYMGELSVDCTSTRAQWDLTPAVAGTFTLRNAADQLSLDVRGGSDVPGAPIIVYAPNTLDNQRFWFRRRSSNTFELAPRHAPTLCAEARGTRVEIWPCATDDAEQVFRFMRIGCP